MLRFIVGRRLPDGRRENREAPIMARHRGREPVLRRIEILFLVLWLGGCATSVVPEFAAKPYAPFNRESAVAIALREWRLFGANAKGQGEAAPKPERAPGLWERIGEYWWLGLGGVGREARWTGKHDEDGRVFAASEDEHYAWSAAFISYVMRIAGAGSRFPYSANHATYVNAAASGDSPILVAHAARSYVPKLGDLLCFGREWAADLSFEDLPRAGLWPGHCAIVVAGPQSGQLDVVGGNENDAVTLSRVCVAADGSLTSADGGRPWPIAIQIRYDAEADSSASVGGNGTRGSFFQPAIGRHCS